eukprot:2789751-Amphidinium_carterae.2
MPVHVVQRFQKLVDIVPYLGILQVVPSPTDCLRSHTETHTEKRPAPNDGLRFRDKTGAQ